MVCIDDEQENRSGVMINADILEQWRGLDKLVHKGVKHIFELLKIQLKRVKPKSTETKKTPRSDVLQTVPVTKPQRNEQEHTAVLTNSLFSRTTWCVRILRWIAVILCIIHLNQCVQFGPDNSYTCHCFNDELCNNDTGECGGVCASGWSSVTCQKQNVALNKPSKQEKSNRTERGPVHKNTDCSNRDSTSKWWRIDLLEEYPIKHITIHPYRASATVNGISIYVFKENGEAELCFKEMFSYSQKPIVKDIECNQVITGRYVNISNDILSNNGRYLTFCHVEIYVCSRGTFGSDCTNFCHCLNNERCSETGECPDGCSDGWTGTTCSQSIGLSVNCSGCTNTTERTADISTPKPIPTDSVHALTDSTTPVDLPTDSTTSVDSPTDSTTSVDSPSDRHSPAACTDPTYYVFTITLGGILTAVIIIVLVAVSLYCCLRSRKKLQKTPDTCTNAFGNDEESHYEYVGMPRDGSSYVTVSESLPNGGERLISWRGEVYRE